MNRYELNQCTPDEMALEKLGEVLNAPAAYFHASSDDLAAVILQFHRLSKAEKTKGHAAAGRDVTCRGSGAVHPPE
jgi:hypothetical protein